MRIVAWNVKKVDGIDRDWSAIAALLADQHPDVKDPLDSRQAHALGQALGMDIHIADSPSTVHTGIAWRPGITLCRWEEITTSPLHHGQALAVLQAPEWSQLLTVLSAHLTPYSVPWATIEAQILTAHLWRFGSLAVLAGDINAVPFGDANPPWHELPPHNRAARAKLGPGSLRPNLAVAYALAHADLIDATAECAERDGDVSLRAPTGAGKIRVDQVHLTSALASTLVRYARLDHRGLSDHHPILVELDMRTIARWH